VPDIYEHTIKDLIDAIQGAPVTPGTLPLSHAVYEVAKSVSEISAPDYDHLSQSILDAAEAIRDGLLAVATAIREHSNE
jgi:hypothetical protein